MVPMITRNLWIGRTDYDIELFRGRKKPKLDEFGGGFNEFPFYEFCAAGWKRTFGGMLGLKKNEVKRFRITIEEIK